MTLNISIDLICIHSICPFPSFWLLIFDFTLVCKPHNTVNGSKRFYFKEEKKICIVITYSRLRIYEFQKYWSKNWKHTRQMEETKRKNDREITEKVVNFIHRTSYLVMPCLHHICHVHRQFDFQCTLHQRMWCLFVQFSSCPLRCLW